MDLGFLTDYCVPVILVACLVIGYCLRHIPKLAGFCEEYMPALMAVIGVVLSIPVTLGSGNGVTVQSLVGGGVTGLASTGLHQIFKKWIEKGSRKDDTA